MRKRTHQRRGGIALWVSLLTLIVAGLLLIQCAVAAERTYIDLSAVANASLENDGQTGWSNEGINDMYMYPPVPKGEFTRNGHWFRLPNMEGTSKSAVMLAGAKMPELPKEVTVDAKGAKGAFVYFLQNSVKGVAGLPAEHLVATYTVKFADGSESQIAIRDGIEIRQWWTREWFANSGPASWPILMGKNVETRKWNHHVGVWAMQWKNPHPDEAIKSIAFRSEGAESPVIFAVTVTNEDYHASPDIKKDYKRPDEAPGDYFTKKLAIESAQLYVEMRKNGMAQGVREVQLIRPDLIAVTIDASIAKGAGMAGEAAAAMQVPEAFAIEQDGGATVAPAKVGRLSYEYWNGNVGRFVQNTFYWHTYYLQLSAPLKTGAKYRVVAKQLPKDLTTSLELSFDEATSITPAIKVNQVGYSELAKRRYAYLGWWAADLGAVDYGGFKNFRVVNEGDQSVALEGSIRPRNTSDELSGEAVYEMDLSALKPGKYHILVPGLGRSNSFAVGGDAMRQLYYDTNRAFLHQRCGHALAKPYSDFTRPACHLEVYKSGFLVEGRPPRDEPKRHFRGGYHDAADYDVFEYHLRSTAQVLAMYALAPEKFTDGDLNLPESGNGVPDVLDEANWGLLAYLETQLPDGGVPYGRGNDEDAIRDWEREHNGVRPEYGLFPPDASWNMEYAATASQYARLVQKYDEARAKEYLASARKAFDWGLANLASSPADRGGKLYAAWAASELFETTGEDAYNAAFKKLYAEGAVKDASWKLAQAMPICIWTYASSKQAGVDPKVQGELKQHLVRMADEIVKNTDLPAYRVGRGPEAKGNGWGNLNGGGRWADPCIRAYVLTKDQKYLDAASLNADFQLGANPLSKTFITGMGARPPLHPQISEFLYTGPGKTGTTVRGITVYGLTGDEPKWYPSIPPWRRWRDMGNGGAEISSEFTITETIGASAMLYSFLYTTQP